MVMEYVQPPTTIDYPDTDGKPMAESDFQRIPLLYAVDALDLYFEDRPDVYVTGNILLYYEEGQPGSVVSPDVFVVFGVKKRLRRSYKVWEDGKMPDFVLEITSKTTRWEDQGAKWGLYAALGVREYFQYDPTGDYLKPALQGWRLDERSYQRLPAQVLNGTLSIYSEVLGLELRIDTTQGQMRFYDPATGERLLSRKESEVARRKAEAARREAETRADQLEAELERLRAQLAGRDPRDPH